MSELIRFGHLWSGGSRAHEWEQVSALRREESEWMQEGLVSLKQVRERRLGQEAHGASRQPVWVECQVCWT